VSGLCAASRQRARLQHLSPRVCTASASPTAAVRANVREVSTRETVQARSLCGFRRRIDHLRAAFRIVAGVLPYLDHDGNIDGRTATANSCAAVVSVTLVSPAGLTSTGASGRGRAHAITERPQDRCKSSTREPGQRGHRLCHRETAAIQAPAGFSPGDYHARPARDE